MWGKIHADHPEMSVDDINGLALPRAHVLLSVGKPKGKGGRRLKVPSTEEQSIIDAYDAQAADKKDLYAIVSAMGKPWDHAKVKNVIDAHEKQMKLVTERTKN